MLSSQHEQPKCAVAIADGNATIMTDPLDPSLSFLWFLSEDATRPVTMLDMASVATAPQKRLSLHSSLMSSESTRLSYIAKIKWYKSSPLNTVSLALLVYEESLSSPKEAIGLSAVRNTD